MEEIMKKLLELEGQVMTKDAVMSMLEEYKKTATGDVEAKLNALIKDVTEIKLGKNEQFATNEQVESKEHKAALEKYFRTGQIAAEMKTMTSNDDTTGGFLAGKQIDRQVIKDIREINSMMAVATIRQTTSKDYVFLKVANLSKAAAVAEGSAGTSKDVTFSKITITTHAYKHTVGITEEDIEDAELNITQIITEQMGEGLSEACEDDFVVGNGVEKAKGFLTDATILAAAAETATSGTFIDEDIITLVGKLKTMYRRNMSFMANRDILTAIAKMKSGDGRFMYSVEPLEKYPSSIGTLMNRPVFEAPSMSGTVAAGNIILAAGDFAKGYCIVERTGTVIKRDDITGQDTGIVKFNGRKRLGGAVIQPEAIAILKVKA